MTDAVPADATTAATLAIHERGEGKCACGSAEEHEHWLAWDEAAAKVALEAAAPHIRAAERERIRRFAATHAGSGDDAAMMAVVQELVDSGAAAERQRIRQLAERFDAICWTGDSDDVPFATLLGQPAGTDTQHGAL